MITTVSKQATRQKTVGQRIGAAWGFCEKVPGGKALFSKMIGQIAPYSGSIGAKILELEPGYCVGQIKERRALKNPFNSIHAVALTNLGELISGLAFNYALPDNVRGIPTRLSIEFFKKSRGVITAECRTPLVKDLSQKEVELLVVMRNQSSEKVAEFKAYWALSLVPNS